MAPSREMDKREKSERAGRIGQFFAVKLLTNGSD
jgi:hypothetical protein